MRLFADVIVPLDLDEYSTDVDMICLAFDDGSTADVGSITTFAIDYYGDQHQSLDTTIRAYRISETEIHVFSVQFSENFLGQRVDGAWKFRSSSEIREPAGMTTPDAALQLRDKGTSQLVKLPRRTEYNSSTKTLSLWTWLRDRQLVAASKSELLLNDEEGVVMSVVLNEGVALFAMPKGCWEIAELIAQRPITTWLLPPGTDAFARVAETSTMHPQLERARLRRLRRSQTETRRRAWSTESIY